MATNRGIVLADVKQTGYALGYTPEELTGENYIALAAVKQSGGALHAASEESRCDREIV